MKAVMFDFFNAWLMEADDLSSRLDLLGPEAPLREQIDIARHAYRWFTREERLGPVTAAQCADAARYFLRIAEMMVTVAARLSGATEKTLQTIEGMRDQPGDQWP